MIAIFKFFAFKAGINENKVCTLILTIFDGNGIDMIGKFERFMKKCASRVIFNEISVG